MTTQLNKVSIILSTYNSNPIYLKKALDSIHLQTYKNIELIVVDDASTNTEHFQLLKVHPAITKTIFLKKNVGTALSGTEGVKAATGEYVGFLDHDDTLGLKCVELCVNYLNENLQYGMVYTDHNYVDKDDKIIETIYKEDYNEDLLLSRMYILHFRMYRRSYLTEFMPMKYHGSQDYDLTLRFSEKYKIGHIRKVLYNWRRSETSTTSQGVSQTIATNSYQAVNDALQRRGIDAQILQEDMPTHWHIDRNLKINDLVSIIILTKNKCNLLKNCIFSIEKFTQYPYEIIIVDTGSTEKDAVDYLKTLALKYTILNQPFNFSKNNNYAVQHAKGKFLLFLNNDMVVTKDWLTHMMKQIQREDVGIVGSKLIYPQTKKIQHAGVVLGLGGVAGHLYENFPEDYPRAISIKEVNAVTGACLLIKKELFDKVGGFDETYIIEFQDIDLNLKVKQLGYKVIFTPHSKIYHYCSATRGTPSTFECNHDRPYFTHKWKSIMLTTLDPNLPTNMIGSDYIKMINDHLERYEFNIKNGMYSNGQK